MKRLLILFALLIPTATLAQSAPKCLFTDVTSGPASGGEGGNGIYVTITGYNFGTTRGTSTVTVNGTPVAQYITWGTAAVSDSTGNRQTIGIQVASGTTGTGNIVVTTAGGSCGASTVSGGSFALPFTVRSGSIYFLGSAVDNTAMPACSTALAANSYTSPWGMGSGGRNSNAYYDCALATAGNTLVLLNGANDPRANSSGSVNSTIKANLNGTSSAPLALMARPGAIATLGSTSTSNNRPITVIDSNNYTVYSGLTLIGNGSGSAGIAPQSYARIVGNTIECPNCTGQAGILDGSSAGLANGVVLGNLITTTGTPELSNKQYHAIYASGNNFEIGWNKIADTGAYNGIQVNEDGSTGWYNFSIHDNDITGANGSGLNPSTVNPGGGYVEFYNNVVNGVGLQRASDGGSSDFHSCLSFPFYQSGTPSGTAAIYNNTFYDCSSILNTYSSGESNSAGITLQNTFTGMLLGTYNNVVAQPSYTYTANYNVYFASSPSGGLTGSKNLFWSGATPASTAPASSLTSLTVPTNPGFTSLSDGSWTNYIPTVSSPLIAAGTAVPTNVHALGQSVPLTWDFQGLTVNPSAPQIGALAFSSGTTFTLTCATAGTGSGGITGSACNALYSPGGSYSFTATPAAGSTFVSWTSSPSCGGTISGNVYSGTMPGANCTITATFNLTTTFTLTATTSGTGTGTVTGATCAGTRAAGASFSCLATPGTGSSFGTWTSLPSCGGTASGTTYSGSMPAANCTVNGSFTLNSYALTTATTGSGTGTVTGCAGSLLYGAAYTCTANPAAGSVFVSWASTCGGTATSNTYHGTMPAAACSVTATFSTTPTYTLSTATAGTGSGTVSGCAGSLIAGAAYSCSATASTGSTFTSWSSTCGGTATGTTYAGSMPAANCTVTATFTLNTWLLSCSTSGSGAGTITGSTCNVTYGFGGSYSFTATASGGSTFGSWTSSPSCGGSASGAVYSGTMPNAACTINASFTLTTPGKGVAGGKGVIGGKGTVGP